MVKTASNMLPLGTKAPEFELLDTISNQLMSLNELKSSKATVVMFICNHCPYVLHINEALIKLANKYIAKDVSFIAISSNDAESYPQDGPDKMKEHAKQLGYPFPYLYDESQEVAHAYHAACTPDFYVFDKQMHLAYRGQMDSSRPGQETPPSGEDLENAIIALLSGGEPSDTQKPSLGCNIKWKL